MADQEQRLQFRDFFLMLDSLHDWLQEAGSVYRIDRHTGAAYRSRWGIVPYMVFTVPPEKAREARMRQRIVEFAAAAAIRKHGLCSRPYFLTIPQIHYEVQHVSFYQNVPALPACLSRDELISHLQGLSNDAPCRELEQALDFMHRNPQYAHYRRTLHPERAFGATLHYSSGGLSQPDVHCNGIILVGEDIRMRFPEGSGAWRHGEEAHEPAFVVNGMSYYCQPDPLAHVESILGDFRAERPDAWL